MSELILTPDQAVALDEITRAVASGHRHVLTGHAGSGKTTLMQQLALWAKAHGRSIVFTAPTHKAVAVLSEKMRTSGQENVQCVTIHTLLGLSPKLIDDRMVFVRKGSAKPVKAEIVVIDECSMLGVELIELIRLHLAYNFVLFVGDPAQLPPVGETESLSFAEPSRSHLKTIVRQGAGNPILDATDIIRASQGGPMDWSWRRRQSVPPYGIFIPNDRDVWMKKAFTSEEFGSNADTFRYVCWTNAQVHATNRKIRQWRYGSHIDAPFVVGERALCRSPVVQDDTIVMATNEEATVVSLTPSVFSYKIPKRGAQEAWTVTLQAWTMVLTNSQGSQITVQMPQRARDLAPIDARLAREAGSAKLRWRDLHQLKAALADFQSVYAMTVHTSQGSTFKNVFMDVADIERRAHSHLLEAQQLLYVAATRPTHALILV